ncbi:phage head-tail adapter protein [Acinetobacter sp. ANC 4558]|uniref:portal protein n=1 Tax=Acinetobacter sp. ANC 4558 TaxID=1977876 RepID=UPI000A32BFE4|nr:portal protein [Acinetobacter sp. ANC 4558]OTG80800.1 phage head-tail adapter protein [Acinetobacter sp. ANC 4558]
MTIDAQKICTRFGQMKIARSVHEAHWGECYRFGAPERQQNFNSTESNQGQRQKERADLFDSTASDSVQVLVSMIMNGVTPSNAIWFKAQPDGIDDLSVLTEGERWLEDVCQFMWRNIHAANFDSESFETVTDIVTAGWGVLYTDIDREAGGGYVFESWHPGNCYVASSRANGVIDTIYREHEMTIDAVVNTYGENSCHISVLQRLESNPDDKIKLLHVIQPRKSKGAGQINKDMPFASYHIDFNNKHTMKESGYNEFPCSVPRLRRIPNSVYGNGQMSIALPDAKTLNDLMKNMLHSTDLALGGMWIGEDDGVLNPSTVRIGPRKIISANSVDSMKRLDTGTNIQVAEYLMNMLQGGVRRKLMADQLPPVGTQQMTATEIHTRVEMIRQMLGPMYGRLQTEYLQSILDRCFGLALRAGALGNPPEDLQGRNLSFKFVSPMARSQRMEEVTATEQYVASLGGMAEVEPEILDNIDFDAVAAVTGTGRGVPQSIMRTKEEVEAIRTQRQEAQKQQEEAQQQQQMMQTVGQEAAKGIGQQVATGALQ